MKRRADDPVSTDSKRRRIGTVYPIHQLKAHVNTNGKHNELHGKLEGHPDVMAKPPELRAELSAATVRSDF